jgi:uncharacterized protein YqgV (UPF0045/DUF77 family)
MIQTQAQLSDFLHAIEDETELAIDTEFKRVNTYIYLDFYQDYPSTHNCASIFFLSIFISDGTG